MLLENRGSALIMAVVFSATFLIVGTGTLKLISRGNEMFARDVKIVKSYWANEAAIQIAMRYLTRATSHPDYDIPNFNSGGIIDINGYQPAVLIKYIPPSPGKHKYDITATSVVDNMNNISGISGISFNTISRYSYFEDQPPPTVPWIGFVVNGNYGANDNIIVGSSMTNVCHVTGEAFGAGLFDGSVSPPGYPGEYGKGIKVIDGGGNVVPAPDPQLNWFKTRIPNYKPCDKIDISPLKPQPGSFTGGWVIEDQANFSAAKYTDYFVNFKKESVKIYGLQKTSKLISGTSYTYYLWDQISVDSTLVKTISTNNNGIIKSSKPVHVAGELDGQLTVVSGMDIYLAGHITYSDTRPDDLPNDPEGNALGLVTGNNFIVQSNTPKYYYTKSGSEYYLNYPKVDWNSTGDKMNIYASLISVNGCLKMGEAASSGWGSNGTNYFNCKGSLLTKAQGGTYSGTNWGFVMNITGDPRFMDNLTAPPGLPDLRSKDTEMRDYAIRKDAIAMSFPIKRELWSNKLH